MDCSELVTVLLPSALKAIPKDTFAECVKLAEDTAINDNVKVDMDAFRGTPLDKKYGPVVGSKCEVNDGRWRKGVVVAVNNETFDVDIYNEIKKGLSRDEIRERKVVPEKIVESSC